MPAVPSIAFPFKGSDSASYSGQTVPLDAGGAVPTSVADGANAGIGAKADAAYADATLAAAGGLVALLKRIFGKLAGTLTSVIAAGEAHIGSIGGEGAHPSAAPAATALSYASGKCIGGLNDLTGFLRVAGKSSLIQSATLRCRSSVAVPLDLVIFRDVPSVTTGLVDGATFVVDPSDLAKVSKVISFPTWNSLGTASLATVDGIGKYMALASGTTAKCIVVARGAVTLSSASDLTPSLGLIQD